MKFEEEEFLYDKKRLEIDNEKIKSILKKGTLTTDDEVGFKYIVEILKLFNINVKIWMKGSYILNNNEGIMFTKEQSLDWSDEVSDNYFYEIYKNTNERIERYNEYWGKRIIYIFRKNKDEYKFIGVYQQDLEKIDELFLKGINNKRPYKKISNVLRLTQ